MRNAATQNRWRDEHVKLWLYRKIAKLRRWRHALRLTAMAVATDSRHRFPKRWHIADVKNITGNDQASLLVDRNSANIAYTFRFYVCLRLRDRDYIAPRLTATAIAMDLRCHFSKRWHVADIKNITGHDQATLMVDRNSANIANTFRFYIYLCVRDRDWCSMTDDNGSCHGLVLSFSKRWHVADVKNFADDDQDQTKFCNFQSLWLQDQTRPLEKHIFCC